MMAELRIDPARRLLKAEEARAWSSREEIIAAAKAEAEEIRQRALADAKTELERGFEEGIQKARVEQSEKLLSTVEHGIKYLAHIENVLTEIVFSAVEKIIGSVEDKKLIAETVKVALVSMVGDETVQVRVHPDCVAHLREVSGEIIKKAGTANFLEFIGDNRLEKTDCVLENNLGTVNASIPLQLDNLKIALKNALGKDSEATIQ